MRYQINLSEYSDYSGAYEDYTGVSDVKKISRSSTSNPIKTSNSMVENSNPRTDIEGGHRRSGVSHTTHRPDAAPGMANDSISSFSSHCAVVLEPIEAPRRFCTVQGFRFYN